MKTKGYYVIKLEIINQLEGERGEKSNSKKWAVVLRVGIISMGQKSISAFYFMT